MDVPPIKSSADRSAALVEFDSLTKAEIEPQKCDRLATQSALVGAHEATGHQPPAGNQTIIARCAALGLSLAAAQRLAGVGHSLQDLAYVLGLDGYTLTPLKPRRWLWMAAQTCSVSYRIPLTPEGLLSVLTTGILPPAYLSTFVHFLEEAPLSIVVMAVEQAAQQSGVAIAQIWRNVDQIAAALSSSRLRAIAA